MQGTPYAYYSPAGPKIPLPQHHQAVAGVLVKLFANPLDARRGMLLRLGWLEKPLRETFAGIKHPLLLASILSASLHDLGKASQHYQRKIKWLKQDDSLKFYGHEYVGFLVLIEARTIISQKLISGKDQCKDSMEQILRLAGHAVARHHSAMEHRHPSKLNYVLNDNSQRDYGIKQAIVRATSLLDLQQVVSSIPPIIKNSLPQISQRIGDAVTILKNLDQLTLVSKLAQGLADSLGGSESPTYVVRDKFFPIALKIVSGALIVADNIASHLERRESDDQTSPVHVRSWLSELAPSPGDIEELELIVKNPGSSQRLVEDALKLALGDDPYGFAKARFSAP